MAIILSAGREPADYFEAIGKFIDAIADRDVKSIALVALCDDGHNVGWYHADSLDVKRMAGILDLAAVRQMFIEEEENPDD